MTGTIALKRREAPEIYGLQLQGNPLGLPDSIGTCLMFLVSWKMLPAKTICSALICSSFSRLFYITCSKF